MNSIDNWNDRIGLHDSLSAKLDDKCKYNKYMLASNDSHVKQCEITSCDETICDKCTLRCWSCHKNICGECNSFDSEVCMASRYRIQSDCKDNYKCPHNSIYCCDCRPDYDNYDDFKDAIVDLPYIMELAIIFEGKLGILELTLIYMKLNERCKINESDCSKSISSIFKIIRKIKDER